jgi:G3E family GTPase
MLHRKVQNPVPNASEERDTGIIAIENLMQKKGRFDYILLETTGLADPGPIASMFWLDDSLGANIYLDGIITVVDAVNIHRSLDKHDNHEHGLSTAHLQISHADALIVNKLDLVSAAGKEGVVQRVRSINSLAKVLETTFARLDTLDDILDLHAYDSAHLPIDEFNRDSSGHLDHVILSPLDSPLSAVTNSSIFQRFHLPYPHYQIRDEKNSISGSDRFYGKGYSLASHPHNIASPFTAQREGW